MWNGNMAEGMQMLCSYLMRLAFQKTCDRDEKTLNFDRKFFLSLNSAISTVITSFFSGLLKRKNISSGITGRLDTHLSLDNEKFLR